jgi:hypothetical protein
MPRYYRTPTPRCRWATFYLLGCLLQSLAPLAVGLSLHLSLAMVV